VPELAVDLAGVRGDRHYGFTRKAGSREPWYPRGTEIRSGRQVTIVSAEELAEIAMRLGLPALPATWIGANIVTEGVAALSHLPAGTRLFFAGNASLVVEGINAPCRDAGRAIVRNSGRANELELAFPKVAQGLRGVVASVERAGTILPDTEMQVRIPEQRIYA
jgi:MOSC domain-containing protein YiiM